jgi:MFS family permease
MMLAAQSAQMTFAAALAVLTLTGRISVTAIYVLSGLTAAAAAFDNPARQSLAPNLVPREHISNAISLNTLTWQFGTIAGPGLAGLLLARFSPGVVYAVDTVSYGAVLLALLLMRYRGNRASPERASFGAALEGLRFTYTTKIVWSTMVLDFLATFFSSARSMLPIVADRILDVEEEGYGILMTGQGVGAVIAGVFLASRPAIRRQGPALLVSVAVYGLATALFGLETSFVPAYILFALTGAGDMVSTVIRGTIRQMETPDRLRGRMTSVNMLFFMGGPQLGEVEAGLAAARFGVRAAIVSGGLATVALTGVVAARYPQLARYHGVAPAGPDP